MAHSHKSPIQHDNLEIYNKNKNDKVYTILIYFDMLCYHFWA